MSTDLDGKVLPGQASFVGNHSGSLWNAKTVAIQMRPNGALKIIGPRNIIHGSDRWCLGEEQSEGSCSGGDHRLTVRLRDG